MRVRIEEVELVLNSPAQSANGYHLSMSDL
jgi:hypothetical protein